MHPKDQQSTLELYFAISNNNSGARYHNFFINKYK